mmetsp:Transcript_26220/g.77861  ORF Transcript_26220/g.77861 Transcript_26220/m.77861 type:complete len:587 (-) Transcript_26220:1722-3482(-)
MAAGRRGRGRGRPAAIADAAAAWTDPETAAIVAVVAAAAAMTRGAGRARAPPPGGSCAAVRRCGGAAEAPGGRKGIAMRTMRMQHTWGRMDGAAAAPGETHGKRPVASAAARGVRGDTTAGMSVAARGVMTSWAAGGRAAAPHTRTDASMRGRAAAPGGRRDAPTGGRAAALGRSTDTPASGRARVPGGLPVWTGTICPATRLVWHSSLADLLSSLHACMELYMHARVWIWIHACVCADAYAMAMLHTLVQADILLCRKVFSLPPFRAARQHFCVEVTGSAFQCMHDTTHILCMAAAGPPLFEAARLPPPPLRPPPLSGAPPALGTIHRGKVHTVRHFGIFVAIEGYRRHVLVYHEQVADDIVFTRDDDNDMRIKAMEFYFPKDTAVWVKVISVTPDASGERVNGSMKAVSQNDGTDLDPTGALTAPGGGGAGGGGGGAGGFGRSDAPPEENTVHRGVVKRIEAYGVFVELEGFRKHGLVHSSQVSNYLSFSREDTDEEKKAELGGVVAPGDKVWVKVVEVTPDDFSGRGPKIGCSMKLVDQTTGEDMDPNGLRCESREDGRGVRRGKHVRRLTARSRRPLGASFS